VLYMCDYCNGWKDDEDIIEEIQYDDVSEEVFQCKEGWAMASRIWNKYGNGQKIISVDEWTAVCRSRGYFLYGR